MFDRVKFKKRSTPNEQSEASIEARPASAIAPPRWELTLFWRTFVMIGMLLTISSVSWLLIIREQDHEPRTEQIAQQIATLVNLSRQALTYADPRDRFSLMRALDEEIHVKIIDRRNDDVIVPIRSDQLDDRITAAIKRKLHHDDAIIAQSVNGIDGLWVSFKMDGDDETYWLRTEGSRFAPTSSWMAWILMAVGLSLAGAAIMTGLVNQPLRQLYNAIRQVHRGDYTTVHLDENVSTQELRQVNQGFNAMLDQLAKVEQDRAIMLAGISHDLRTPLARVRLEVEMSMPDEEARKLVAEDIEQMDGVINKFMDYARPESRRLMAINAADSIQAGATPYMHIEDMQLKLNVPAQLTVLGDDVELKRLVANLLENARRYGKSADGITYVDLTAYSKSHMAYITLRDHGAGVPADILDRLTQPFFRADQARTSAVGSGLGLAIVKKIAEHMDGKLVLSNHRDGGLQAEIMLPLAKS